MREKMSKDVKLNAAQNGIPGFMFSLLEPKAKFRFFKNSYKISNFEVAITTGYIYEAKTTLQNSEAISLFLAAQK